eukprot:12616479-Alexandrium_andersonii.AAC.1
MEHTKMYPKSSGGRSRTARCSRSRSRASARSPRCRCPGGAGGAALDDAWKACVTHKREVLGDGAPEGGDAPVEADEVQE